MVANDNNASRSIEIKERASLACVAREVIGIRYPEQVSATIALLDAASVTALAICSALIPGVSGSYVSRTRGVLDRGALGTDQFISLDSNSFQLSPPSEDIITDRRCPRRSVR